MEYKRKKDNFNKRCNILIKIVSFKLDKDDTNKQKKKRIYLLPSSRRCTTKWNQCDKGRSCLHNEVLFENEKSSEDFEKTEE